MSEQTSNFEESSWIGQFFSFEKLIGSGLIKFVYFAGLLGIALVTLLLVVGSLATMGSGRGLGIAGLFVFPLIAAFVVVVWRFYCELAILAFQIYARMGEIRDRLPPPA